MHERPVHDDMSVAYARAYRYRLSGSSFILLRAVSVIMLEFEIQRREERVRIGEYVIEGDASHTAHVRRHYSHAAHGVCALQSSS